MAAAGPTAALAGSAGRLHGALGARRAWAGTLCRYERGDADAGSARSGPWHRPPAFCAWVTGPHDPALKEDE